MRMIRRLRSGLATNAAVEKLHLGRFVDAKRLLRRAIALTGDELILPHLILYQCLMMEGRIEDGLKKREEIERVASDTRFSDPNTRNYLRFVMLHSIPDSRLAQFDKTDIFDPTLSTIDKLYLNRFPYREPTPAISRILSSTSVS